METDQKQALKKARIQSVVLALCFIIAVLGVIFGITQSIQADRNLEMAVANEKMALAAKVEADRQRDIANAQTARVVEIEREVARMAEEVQKTLADCGKKK